MKGALRRAAVHVMSMRKCNDEEQTCYSKRLKKVDAHVIRPAEYDEAPELTDAR
jgi:hypothetical protein